MIKDIHGNPIYANESDVRRFSGTNPNQHHLNDDHLRLLVNMLDKAYSTEIDKNIDLKKANAALHSEVEYLRERIMDYVSKYERKDD